jgi:GT2 family glycosyltransferase
MEVSDISFPLSIRYVDLDADADAPVFPEDDRTQALTYFRLRGIPVGHRFISPGDASSLRHPKVAIDEAICRHLSSTLESPSTDLGASVLICTRDRAEDLRKCLASLVGQTMKPREIIVVDNASKTGQTRDVVLAAGATYVREDRPGLDFARNAAIRAATADIVAFTDDDVVLHPLWLENLTKAFDRPEIVCVTGLVLPGELDTPAQFVFETRWGFGRGYKRIDFGPDYYVRHHGRGCPVWEIGAGASQAFRRSVFADVGLFDTRLDVGAAGCCGDSELWNRLLFHGYTCRYEPTAVAWHFHRREMEGLRKQIRAYMSGHTASLLVQYQRTGGSGNLKRVLFSLPRYYARKLYRYARWGRRADTMFVFSEIKGCLEGIWFIVRRPRIPEARF